MIVIDVIYAGAIASAGAILAVLLDLGLRYYREHVRRDAERAEIAARLLESHREAVGKVLSTPELSPVLEAFLLDFSELILKKSAAEEFFQFIRRQGDAVVASDKGEDDLDVAMTAFRCKGADCDEALSRALRTGLTALVVQWPDVNKQFQTYLAEIATDTSPQVMSAARRLKDSRKRDFSPPTAGLPALG